MSSNMFVGVRIIQSAMAQTIETKFSVAQHPIKKRRRNWRVVRTETMKPCAWKLADGTIVMHPELFAKLKQMGNS